jgi:bifunctional non-homologous end joining protein LigD
MNTQRKNRALPEIPKRGKCTEIEVDGRIVKLTNLDKPFWPECSLTKADLLQYYADVSPLLLPHLRDRAMVMKRHPHGAHGEYFFMKRAPSPRPDWIEICAIQHKAGMVDFPMVQDLSSLLWIINLACIDLNPWYSRCDDVNRPDFLHFDLDPAEGAEFKHVRETALLVRDALTNLKMPTFAKTTGSTGIHIYVPIVRGPLQKQVWTFAKTFAQAMEVLHPQLITAKYLIEERPHGRVLVDYNQNAWGKTLASVYSPRPRQGAPVSMPVTWEEIENGVEIEDFHLKNAMERLSEVGDLWKPLLSARGRVHMKEHL